MQVFSLCQVPPSVRLGVADITIFAANAVVKPDVWELRSSFFAEPSDVFHQGRVFGSENFTLTASASGGHSATAIFGADDLTNYTTCYAMDLLPALRVIHCIVGTERVVAAYYAGQQTADGQGVVICRGVGPLTSKIASGVILSITLKDGAVIDMIMPLCVSRRERVLVSACSQPLYDLQGLEQEHPTVLHDWLAFHRAIGIDRFSIYDTDGSMKALVQRYDFVEYWQEWSRKISRSRHGFRALASRYPLCTQKFAYTHCLISNFGLSDWVMLLHAPDEYLNVHAGYTQVLDDLIPRTFNYLIAEGNQSRHALSELHINMYSFRASELREGRGSVVASSWHRALEPDLFRGVPALNPDVCIAVDGHRCILGVLPGQRSMRNEGRRILPPNIIRVNHYTEMLARDLGRCARIGPSTCNVIDEGLVWVPTWFAVLEGYISQGH